LVFPFFGPNKTKNRFLERGIFEHFFYKKDVKRYYLFVFIIAKYQGNVKHCFTPY